MIKHLKRLFGIKPTEAKVEVAPVQEVVVTQVSEPEVVEVIVTPEPEVVTEVVEVIVTPEPEVVAEVVEVKEPEVKKTNTRKPKVKKAVK